jgi:enoyl-CoA hydratase/carnithine racemase
MNDIRITREPPLAWVTLDRPERRNAVTAAMWAALPEIVRQLEADEAMRVVVLNGAGDAAFSAGADIREMEDNLGSPERMRAMQDAVQVAQSAWAGMDRPTIAMIRGACTGGGCGLALACDLRVATHDSVFAIPPARLGLVYSLVDTRRLVDLVGPAVAKEILFTGRRVGAVEALAFGLVNRIVDAAELEATTRALAADIATSAQSSVRAAKHIVNAIAAGAHAETPESRHLYDAAFGGEDFREGARAFLEKRAPRFR